MDPTVIFSRTDVYDIGVSSDSACGVPISAEMPQRGVGVNSGGKLGVSSNSWDQWAHVKSPTMTYPSVDEGSAWRAGTSEAGLDRLSTRQPAATNFMGITRLGAQSRGRHADGQERVRDPRAATTNLNNF